PERNREMEEPAVVAEAEEAVLAPAVGTRTCVLVGEVVPCITVGGIVLPDRSPLAFAEVVPPAPPLHAFRALLQAAVLSREDGGSPRRSLRRAVQSHGGAMVLRLEPDQG